MSKEHYPMQINENGVLANNEMADYLPLLRELNSSSVATEDFVKKMPKIELHVHMEGSIRPTLLLSIAESNKVNLPFFDDAGFANLLNYRHFKDFARVLLMGVQCLKKAQNFYDVIVDMGHQLSLQHVVYAEVTWTPQFYFNREDSLDQILAAMNEARRHVKERWEVEIRWIPDLVRSYPGPAVKAYQWLMTKDLANEGIVALGLGGPEEGNPAGKFKHIFSHAREHGLMSNPHAGESAGPESIWDTIENIYPTRIGHGVRAVEDAKLMEFIARTELLLEVCPTSNLRLGVYKDLSEHPLKRLIEAGCKVSINSDDPVLFGTNLTTEYWRAIRECGLTPEVLVGTVFDALNASYLSEKEKAEIRQKVTSWYCEFQAGVKIRG